MKKRLILFLGIVCVLVILAACLAKTQKSEDVTTQTVTQTTEGITKKSEDYLESKMYLTASQAGIDIIVTWSDVREEYKAMQGNISAKNDLTSYNREAIGELVNIIEKNFLIVRQGISKAELENAKEMYLASSELLHLGKQTKIDNNVTLLASASVDYLLHLIGADSKTKMGFIEAENNIRKMLALAVVTKEEAADMQPEEIEEMKEKQAKELSGDIRALANAVQE